MQCPMRERMVDFDQWWKHQHLWTGFTSLRAIPTDCPISHRGRRIFFEMLNKRWNEEHGCWRVAAF